MSRSVSVSKNAYSCAVGEGLEVDAIPSARAQGCSGTRQRAEVNDASGELGGRSAGERGERNSRRLTAISGSLDVELKNGGIR